MSGVVGVCIVGSTMIERDDDIPEFPVLRQELSIAEGIAARTLSAHDLQQTTYTALRKEAGLVRTA